MNDVKNQIPVLIDTDPGVDDAMAILLAHRCEKLNLKAVTVVAGNMPLEIAYCNAWNLKQIFHMEAEVVMGHVTPDEKLIGYRSSAFHGESGMGTIRFERQSEVANREDAVDLIYRQAKAAGGKLVLLAIGPLTNIAAAVEKYPDLPELVARLVIMGGTTGKGNVSEFAEFNFWFDSQACKKVLEAGFDTDIVGLNATDQCPLSEEQLTSLRNACDETSPEGKFLAELTDFLYENAFNNGRCTNIIYDAVTVASFIDEAVCSFESHYVSCEPGLTAKNRGQLLIDVRRRTNWHKKCRIAVAADGKRFYQTLTTVYDNPSIED